VTRTSATPDPDRQAAGRYGALLSWANTPDRTARTRRAREVGPNSIGYWLNRLDPERFADATEKQKLAAADAAKSAHYAEMAMKSAAARRRRGGDAA